jgi:arylsulfatase A-like enzyme
MFRDQPLPPIYGHMESYLDRGFKYEVTGKLERQARHDYDEMFEHYRYNYYGMCRLIDDQLKRLEDILAREGVADNTLIFFVSDHGDFVGDYGLMRKGPGLPDTLCRIPFLIKGPGIIPGTGASHAHVNLIDIFPTICELIGTPLPHGVQGRSLVPMLRGEPVPEEEFDTAFCETGYGGRNYGWEDSPDLEKYICTPGTFEQADPRAKERSFNELNEYALGGSMRMVRHQDWKLIVDGEGLVELYNLKADPAELKNLGESSGREAVAMKALLMEKMVVQMIQNEDPLCNVRPTSVPDRQKVHPCNYRISPAEDRGRMHASASDLAFPV